MDLYVNFTIEMTKGFFDFLVAPLAIAVDIVNGCDRNIVFLLCQCRRNLVISTILFSLFLNQTKKKKKKQTNKQNPIKLGARFCKFNTLKKRKKNNEDPIWVLGMEAWETDWLN